MSNANGNKNNNDGGQNQNNNANSRSAFMKNIVKVKNKNTFDDPTSNP